MTRVVKLKCSRVGRGAGGGEGEPGKSLPNEIFGFWQSRDGVKGGLVHDLRERVTCRLSHVEEGGKGENVVILPASVGCCECVFVTTSSLVWRGLESLRPHTGFPA